MDEAYLGTHTNIHSPGTAITVKATRGASAAATADGGAGGILAGGAIMKAVSSVTGAIKAHGDDNATIGTSAGKPNGLQVLANDYATSAANATVGAGMPDGGYQSPSGRCTGWFDIGSRWNPWCRMAEPLPSPYAPSSTMNA